jgi:lysophospholipase L1-like esterase
MKRQVNRVIAVVLVLAASLLGTAAPAHADQPGGRAPILLQFGDSVAAGVGLPLLDPATDLDRACFRSSQAYAVYAAQLLQLDPVNLACSGATTWNGIITDQDTSAGPVPAQLTQARQHLRPRVVALTIGANDIQWSSFLNRCIGLDNNCATDANTSSFHALLDNARIGVLISLIGIMLLGPDRVLVTGYYDPFVGNLLTPTQAGFTDQEITWYRARLDELNAMLSQLASIFPRTRFVPIEFASGGPQLVQAPRLPNREPDPAPFHPTAAGQQEIAKAVAAAATR